MGIHRFGLLLGFASFATVACGDDSGGAASGSGGSTSTTSASTGAGPGSGGAEATTASATGGGGPTSGTGGDDASGGAGSTGGSGGEDPSGTGGATGSGGETNTGSPDWSCAPVDENSCNCTKKPPGAGNNIGCDPFPCCFVYGGGSTCGCSNTEESTCVATLNQVGGERFDSCPPP